MDIVSPTATAGVVVTESETIPAKPFRLVSVRVKFQESPLPRVMSPQFEAITKVGEGTCLYVAVRTVSCDGNWVPFEKRTQVVVPTTLEFEQPIWNPIVASAVPVML
jgi:hypothetical protein